MSHTHIVHIPLTYPKISNVKPNAYIDGLLGSLGQVMNRQPLPKKLFGLRCKFRWLRATPTMGKTEVVTLRFGFAVDEAYHAITILLQVE
jgi:hypothetical protein